MPRRDMPGSRRANPWWLGAGGRAAFPVPGIPCPQHSLPPAFPVPGIPRPRHSLSPAFPVPSIPRPQHS
eukprot:80136-Chlamydomonas_euryale.AAC.1